MNTKLTLKDILGPMRLPFLLLPPVCVALGVGVAFWRTGELNWWFALLALIGAVSSHISVNAFNEYFDFKSGLDALTSKTPFSGGSGTLPQRPEAAKAALVTSIVTLVIPLLIGVYFLQVWGWGIVPLGIFGLLIVFGYTKWITLNWFFCLIAPGLGFGMLWVMGTDYVLTGSYSMQAGLASLIPFFLVSNLLLLNQFPDVEADRQVGRQHLPIVIGRQASARVYIAFLALTYLSLIVSVAASYLPVWALLGLATLLFAIPAGKGAYQNADDIGKLIPHMGQNVMINLLTPLLTAIGLFIAALLP
ncbi:MAG: prenyltransferase [Anaerolineales bacterium]|nr:prenyltransferase [Anaerolineales bacterium]